MVKRGLLLGVALVFSATAFAATPFAGKWEAKFTGGDQGHCAIHIKASGQLNGTCLGRNEGKPVSYSWIPARYHHPFWNRRNGSRV